MQDFKSFDIEDDCCYKFWTHNFAGVNSDASKLLNYWCCNETITNWNLYPNKLKNLNGKPLVLSTFNFKPYVNIETERGVELMMVISFAEMYNFTIKYIIEKDVWGKVVHNFTGKGSQYRTATGESDISVGGFYGMEKRYFYNQFSVPTIRNGILYLVPAPSPGRGLTSPLRSFSTVGWLLIGIFLLVILGFYHILFYLYSRLKIDDDDTKSVGDPFFNTCGILLQQPVDIKFKLFGSFTLLFGVIFIAFYSSGLASSMTKPKYKHQIKTGIDLEGTKFDIIGYSTSYISGIESDGRYQSIIKRFIVMNEKELQSYIKVPKKFALALDHLDLGYSLGEYETVLTVKELENLRLLQEDLSYDFCVLLGYKHSVIFPLLNKHLYKLKESGLDYYWLARSFKDMDTQIQMYLTTDPEEYVTVKLSWTNVEGAFGFWGIGLLVAGFVFIYELYKERRIPRLSSNKIIDIRPRVQIRRVSNKLINVAAFK